MFLSLVLAAQAGALLGPDDVCAAPRVGAPVVSPDGSLLVYTVETCDLEANRYQSDLWWSETRAGSTPHRLTTDPASDGGPVWSPDGHRLAFVSGRQDGSQVWIFDDLRGEPWQLTHQEGGAGGPLWTPDGGAVLYTSRGPAPSLDLLKGEDVQVHDDVLYRKSAHWEQARPSQVYRQDLAGGDALRLTDGPRDKSELAPSPDGRWLAYVREPEHAGGLFSIDTDVWLLPLDGGEAHLLTKNPGPDHAPVWAPDGRSVLTRSILEPGYESGRRRLLRWPLDGGDAVELTADLDLNVVGARFSDDGRSVLALMEGPGARHLVRLEDGAQPITSGWSTVWGFSQAGGTLAVVAGTADEPDDIYIITGRHAVIEPGRLRGARRLTTHAQDAMAGFELSAARPLWTEANDRRVLSLYYPPVHAPQDGAPPMVVSIHGGPQGQARAGWSPDRQLLAAAGYAVLAVNFTGSTGRGQAWTDAIAGDWGGAPYEDVMAAVDDCVAQGLADGGRLGVMGGSYGGYLTAWVIGHTDRFGAAVVGRGVSELVSMYGTTDEQFFPEHDVPGTPWSNPEGYRRWSPLTYADKVHTPTLIVHGEGDSRVPVQQAEQLFTALLRAGVETRLAVFPGEGHGLAWHGTPVHRRERQRMILEWLDAHLGEPTTAP